ncbi:putative protein FAR1-RELATED SEQUENCE 10 [Phalaenopsis equestris]|uniref:putative protein FAR1-RELATED SEQUENCE 10 n=1 Tax=Phalaenopsis equestris TaxID=78828 RepID=UPI0009E41758|nr:putative protein FAR1-RELATED SEQUENCE 10 [Phalaenopsis equestris]
MASSVAELTLPIHGFQVIISQLFEVVGAQISLLQKFLDSLLLLQHLDEGEAKCRDESGNILFETVVHNEKEAYEVYCAYAHHIGFSVRKEHDTFWPNSKNLKTKDFVCGRAGFKKELKATQIVKYKRADTRSGFPAMIRYAVDAEGNWTVKKFIESHNHSLANPGEKHLLWSSRKISEVNAEVLKLMTQSGIRPRDAFNFLATEVGGVEKLECTKIDAFNFIQRERRCRIENGDANALLQLFTERRVALLGMIMIALVMLSFFIRAID